MSVDLHIHVFTFQFAVNEFYNGNRFRNAVVRQDFPTALHEQIKEREDAVKQAELHHMQLLEQ